MAQNLSDKELLDEYYKRVQQRAGKKPTSCSETILYWVLALLGMGIMLLLIRMAGAS